MILKKINSSNRSDIEFVERVYIESFPSNERRSVLEFQHLILEEGDFTVYLLVENDDRVGMLTTWNFDDFIFAEHFAIGAEFRNEGYGKTVMNKFVEEISKPLLIEVEMPDTEIAARRIGFYERLGFNQWNDIAYAQPPYNEGDLPIPMILMTYGFEGTISDVVTMKDAVVKKVYKGLSTSFSVTNVKR